MTARGRTGLAGAVGLLAGAALTAGWIGGGGAPSAGGPPPDAAAPAPPPHAEALGQTRRRLDALAAALDAERTARQALAQEVATLRDRLARADVAARADAEASGDEAPDPAPEPGGAGFDARALAALRMDPGEIDRLRERFDALALEELYLRNRAAREGWANRPRLLRELRELRREARREIGDEDYDCLLYAAGRNNRVIVAGVLPNSPAERAGVARGDAIVSYADGRVFGARELTRATESGELGELTEARVRGPDGRERRLFVPRGPLGVRLRPDRRPCDRG